MMIITNGKGLNLMKPTFKKWIALLTTLALLLSLAACAGSGEPEDTTGDTTPSAGEAPVTAGGTAASLPDGTSDTTGPSASESAAESQTSSQTAATKPVQQQGTTAAASKAPSGVKEIVAYYNAAVKKIAKTSAVYSRKITSGSVSVVNLNLTEQKYAAVINRNNVALSGSSAALKALSTADVSNATCTESGGNYILTLSLKPQSGTDNALKQGAGGYFFFAELDEISSTVNAVGEVLGVSGITVKTASIALSNGKLTVTVNPSSGKISKATLTFTENVDATAKYLLLSPAAKLSVNFTVNYTAS